MATVITFTAGHCGMTKRDFLASHNLAKAGTRGRFSTKAAEFLDQAIAAGVTFDEPVKAVLKVTRAEVKATETVAKVESIATAKQADAVQKWTAPAVSLQTIVRPQQTHYGLSQDGFIVGWDTCSDCLQPVQYCKHDIPAGPAGVEFVTTDKSEVMV